MKLGADELRKVDANDPSVRSGLELNSLKRRPLYLILDNIYDTYNIGGLFRLADALNVSKMYLCGEMETPPNPRIAKASIGTYKIVPWAYKATVGEAIAELRSQKSVVSRQSSLKTENRKPITVVAVEQAKGAVDYSQAVYSLPLALVVGNETHGVGEATLKLCDQIVEIPMWGINKSLNVIVSAAIVAYYATSMQL